MYILHIVHHSFDKFAVALKESRLEKYSKWYKSLKVRCTNLTHLAEKGKRKSDGRKRKGISKVSAKHSIISNVESMEVTHFVRKDLSHLLNLE